MPRGGKRPGSGRPKGSKNIKKPGSTDNPVIAIPKSDEPPSLAFMRSVMDHPDIDVRIRMDAAKTLAPYEAVRKGEVGKRKEQDDTAKKAGTGKFAPSAPPKLVANGGRTV